jgi:hypothetical protein
MEILRCVFSWNAVTHRDFWLVQRWIFGWFGGDPLSPLSKGEFLDALVVTPCHHCRHPTVQLTVIIVHCHWCHCHRWLLSSLSPLSPLSPSSPLTTATTATTVTTITTCLSPLSPLSSLPPPLSSLSPVLSIGCGIVPPTPAQTKVLGDKNSPNSHLKNFGRAKLFENVYTNRVLRSEMRLTFYACVKNWWITVLLLCW